MEIAPLQALRNLYMAARKSPLSADDHEIVHASAVVLERLLMEPAASLTPTAPFVEDADIVDP